MLKQDLLIIMTMTKQKKKWNTHWLKQQASPLDAETQQGAAASQGGKHLDFSYSETWTICWGHLETALFDGCRMPPKAPGKGAEILVTDWCWGHLTKDDPTSSQFTPAPQEKLRNCLPSGDDCFYSFQKAVAPDKARSHHWTGAAGELSGMAPSVLSQHSTADPAGVSHSAPDMNYQRTIKRCVCQWIKPRMQRALPCLQRLPCPFSTSWKALPGREAPLEHQLQQCKDGEKRTSMRELLADSSAAQLMRDIFFSPPEDRKPRPWHGQLRWKRKRHTSVQATANPCFAVKKTKTNSSKKHHQKPLQTKTTQKTPKTQTLLKAGSVPLCEYASHLADTRSI